MANLRYYEAIDRFAEAIENLTYEHFCRGSDALGEYGQELVAATFQMLSVAFKQAAEVFAQKKHADDDAQELPPPF